MKENGAGHPNESIAGYREALDTFRSVKADDRIKKVSKELDAVERLLRAR